MRVFTQGVLTAIVYPELETGILLCPDALVWPDGYDDDWQAIQQQLAAVNYFLLSVDEEPMPANVGNLVCHQLIDQAAE